MSWTLARPPRPTSRSGPGSGWGAHNSLLLRAWRFCRLTAPTTSWTSTFPQDWDRAQPGPALVLTQGRGGRAHIHYPDKNSGTYLTHARLPVIFGAAGASLGAGKFRVHLLDYNATTREVRIRVRRGPGVSPEVVIDSQRGYPGLAGSRQRHHHLGAGRSALPVRDLAVREDRTLAAGRDRRDLRARCSRHGGAMVGRRRRAAAAPPSGTRTITVTVRVANPKFQTTNESRQITLSYDIEPLPNGSRLKLRNRPEDESFKLRIEVTLSNSVGSGSAITWVDFVGPSMSTSRRSMSTATPASRPSSTSASAIAPTKS